MNRWECQHHGCTSSAVGMGGAIGLRAIGWYFSRGPHLFCPAHRPDATNESFRPYWHQWDTTEEKKKEPFPCSACQGDREAERYQVAMGGEPWAPADTERNL